MARARVCFVTYEYHPDIGGLGKSALRIARFLGETYDLELVTPTPTVSAGRVATTMEHGFRVHRVGKQLDDEHSIAHIRQVIDRIDRQSPFDIFHGFFLPCAIPCLDLSRGRPVIASIRGNDAVGWFERPEWTEAIRRAVGQSTWVTTVASDLLSPFGLRRSPGAKCSLLFNSIDLTRHEVKWSANINRGVVGTLANLREKKNLPLLVSGYSRIHPSLKSRLVLAGGFDQDPELEGRLLDLAAELGLADQMTLLGSVPPRNVPSVLSKLYVFALTSNHDGMANALLEAAATGIPLVATAVGAVPDIMTDEVDGLIVPPREPEALARALSRILSDPVLATRLSLGARRLAERFDYSAERSQWMSLYRQLLYAPAEVS